MARSLVAFGCAYAKATALPSRSKHAADVYDRTGDCERNARNKSNTMTLNVDLVIVGMTAAAAAAATDAARRGQRVLVVGESKDARHRRGFRRALDGARDGCRQRVSVGAGFEVLSVDGIGAVEVVLICQVKTGRLIGINTSAVLCRSQIESSYCQPSRKFLMGG